MGWTAGGSFVVGKSCPAPVPCGPISRLTLSESGGLRGCTGLGCRSCGVASTFDRLSCCPRHATRPSPIFVFPGPILCEPNGTRRSPGEWMGVLPTRTVRPHSRTNGLR